MSVAPHHPWIQRFAAVTACVALLPIVVGALVTTMGWGMAFLDWPSSDGHGMFAYPWLQALVVGAVDKFGEHGHRLAGILIGFFSMALAGLAWRLPCRSETRTLSALVLGGVIVQGLLGGQRVLFDARVLAMLHGALAAVVFAAMALVVQTSGRGWLAMPAETTPQSQAVLRRHGRLAAACVGLVGLQYALGGLLRHLQTALFEHVGGAVAVLIAATVLCVSARRTGNRWIARSGTALLALVVVQLGLGVAAFVTKYGFPWNGYVAVQGSLPQILARTSHTVVGILLFAATVVHFARVARCRHGHAVAETDGATLRLSTTATVGGGAR